MVGDPRDVEVDVVFDDDDDEDDGERAAGTALASGRVPRDTMKPAFDIEKYAASLAPRERLSTIVDEEATEQARLASVLMDSTPPRVAAASVVDVFGSVSASAAGFGALDAASSRNLLRVETDEVGSYRARLAPMTRIPRLVRPITELGAFIDDPKTAFLLGFVDGLLPLDMIVEVAGLPELDALRILDRAVGQYVLTFGTDE